MKFILSAVAVFAIAQGRIGVSADTPSSLLVHTVSWNSGDEEAPDDLNAFVGLSDSPDVVAVAVQGNGFKSKSSGTPKCVTNFPKTLSDYVKVKSTVYDKLALIVYVLKKHEPGNWNHTTAVGTIDDANKSGGIVTSFFLYGKSFSFVTSRMSDNDAKTGTAIKYYDTTLDYSRGSPPSDFLFWFGDLNVRVVGKDFQEAKALVDANKFDELLKNDQLKKDMSDGKAFGGWTEPKVTFKPTFKFQPNTEEYDNSATPSWTDRSLYKAGSGKTVNEVKYTSLPNFKQTDHRPVMAQFRVNL